LRWSRAAHESQCRRSLLTGREETEDFGTEDAAGLFMAVCGQVPVYLCPAQVRGPGFSHIRITKKEFYCIEQTLHFYLN
jgi:hypothetical protein